MQLIWGKDMSETNMGEWREMTNEETNATPHSKRTKTKLNVWWKGRKTRQETKGSKADSV